MARPNLPDSARTTALSTDRWNGKAHCGLPADRSAAGLALDSGRPHRIPGRARRAVLRLRRGCVRRPPAKVVRGWGAVRDGVLCGRRAKGRSGSPVARVVGRHSDRRPRARHGFTANSLQRCVLQRASCGPARKVLGLTNGFRYRISAVPTSRVRLGQKNTRWCWTSTEAPTASSTTPSTPDAADAGNQRLCGPGGQPEGVFVVRSRLPHRRPAGLGRRRLFGHHGGRRRGRFAAIYRLRAAGHYGVQLRGLHEQLDHRPRHAVPGCGGGGRPASTCPAWPGPPTSE